jgi:hypothetical protein
MALAVVDFLEPLDIDEGHDQLLWSAARAGDLAVLGRGRQQDHAGPADLRALPPRGHHPQRGPRGGGAPFYFEIGDADTA